MKSRLSINIILTSIIVAAVFSGTLLRRAITHPENLRWDLSRGSITSLKPETILALAALPEPVKVTYYTTEKKRMPTPLRRMEDDIRALLREMQQRSGGKFTYTVINPEDMPQIARSMGRFGITPFQYKTILRDEYSVSTVWSCILIEYKGQTRSIPYITPNHLRYLEQRLITRITQVDTGYKPIFALSAPAGAGYETAKALILEQGYSSILPFDLKKTAEIPVEADFAMIADPDNLPPSAGDAIQRFSEDGKDVILCLSRYTMRPAPGGYTVIPKKSGLEEYFMRRGITVEPKILCDKSNHYETFFMLKIREAQLNLEGFVLQRSGDFNIPFAAPIVIDREKLKQQSLLSDTLAFTTIDAWGVPAGSREHTVAESVFTAPASGNTKIENVGIVVASENPWQGRIFLFASGSLFTDVSVSRGGGKVYFKNLLMTFAKPEKLVSLRVNRSGRPMIQQVSGRQRFFWRLVGVFAIPALLLVILAIKIIRVHEFRHPVRLLDLAIAAGFVAGIVLITGMKMTLRPAGAFRYDISRERASAVDPRAAKWLAALQKPAKVRYFTSPANDMPINARDMENHVYTQLQALADASAGKLTISREIVPAAAEENKTLRATLDRFAIKPFKMRLIEEDRYVEKNVYSGLVFEYGDAVETIPQLTRQNAQRIEFLVVAAFKRLADGKKPRIALVADMPHLSAGEFWELQQLESKIMPRSEDVYAGLIHILKNEGYQVTVYDSKAENRFTEDLLIFLQPWVVSDHMHKEFNRYLRSGGKVMLATQHFNMQVRKYSGLAYEVSYWPGPQFVRINELLEPYGIELVREVFFDQSKASILTKEQVRWGAYKKWGRTAPDAQPFIIRAIPSNYDAQSPITSRLSDILFIWGNRWRTIKENFPEGLSWRPLIRSTPDSWGFDWQGGFLSPEILKGGDYLDEGQPLAVLVEGVFPAIKGAFAAPEKAGRLLLLGSSKIFANDQIEYDRYDHEKFILNAVADLVYGTEFARMQAWGTTAAAGFGFVPPAQKLLWRGFGIIFAPLAFAAFGLWYRRNR